MEKKTKYFIGIMVVLVVLLAFYLLTASECKDGIVMDNGCKFVEECSECDSETECSNNINCNEICESKGMKIKNVDYCGPDVQNLINMIESGKSSEITEDDTKCYCCCE